MRYLGIDFGSKRVGLALSDEAGMMGFPHAIIANNSSLIDELCKLIERESVGSVVIGESRNLDGTENQIMAEARKLGESLAERAGVPVLYEPEAFTTEAARQAPHKLGKTRSPKSDRALDDSAAALILTSYLSRAKHE